MNTILEPINSTGRAFVGFALPMLVQASVLILVLLLADLLLRKKVRAVFRYWIWLLVLVKLVLPTSLSSPWSLGRWFGEELAYVQKAPAPAEPQVDAALPVPANLPPLTEPAPIEIGNYAPLLPPAAPTMPDAELTVAEPVAPPPMPLTPLSWQAVVFLAWLAVVSAMGLLLLHRAIFVRGLVGRAGQADGLMTDTLERCRERIGVKRKIGLRVSAGATCPAVCGLFRPVILVPEGLAPSLNSHQLRAVCSRSYTKQRRYAWT